MGGRICAKYIKINDLMCFGCRLFQAVVTLEFTFICEVLTTLIRCVDVKMHFKRFFSSP